MSKYKHLFRESSMRDRQYAKYVVVLVGHRKNLLVDEEEYDRFISTGVFPLRLWCDLDVYFDENGATITKDEAHEAMEKAKLKRIYFLREKIICLKNLIEIPELFQEVYYTHKKTFFSLMKKV